MLSDVNLRRCLPMKICWIGALMTLATPALLGCEAASTVQPEPFELDGAWLYLGPSDGPHTLKISDATMTYADIAGEWSSNWTVKEHHNGVRQFQVVFASGTGTYLPVGQKMNGTYVLDGAILTVQLANGSYASVQSPGSCTDGGSTPLPDCRLYVRQQP